MLPKKLRTLILINIPDWAGEREGLGGQWLGRPFLGIGRGNAGKAYREGAHDETMAGWHDRSSTCCGWRL